MNIYSYVSVQNSLKSVLHTLTQQSEQLRLVMNAQAATAGLTPTKQVISLQAALQKVSQWAIYTLCI